MGRTWGWRRCGSSTACELTSPETTAFTVSRIVATIEGTRDTALLHCCLVCGVQCISSMWAAPGLVFKVHRRLYHSTLGLRVIKKKKRVGWKDKITSRADEKRPSSGPEKA